MAWTLTFAPEALKDLKKIDKASARRIVATLEERIASRDDPRMIGAALKGEHAGYWRWRIGDYRVIARVDDEKITILVVRVGHRRDVYR